MVALGLVACGAPAPSPPSPAVPSGTSAPVNVARIDRVRVDLPAGYETADLGGPVSPAAQWGYGAEPSSVPVGCGLLADPLGGHTATGWSASGPGGIVYAVAAPAPGAPDPAVIAECGQWTLSGGQTTGTAVLRPAPAVEDAVTVAMTTASTTVVEGGTTTRSQAETVTAYLGDHVAFVSVVTDPGSPDPQLGAQFADSLIVKTVAALRG